MEEFPAVLARSFAAQDPDCSASPLRYLVQAAFKMRSVLPWMKLGLAEI